MVPVSGKSRRAGSQFLPCCNPASRTRRWLVPDRVPDFDRPNEEQERVRFLFDAENGRQPGDYEVLLRDAKGRALPRLNSAKKAALDPDCDESARDPLRTGTGLGALIPLADLVEHEESRGVLRPCHASIH